VLTAAIIIPTRNSARTLRSCLESIRNQSAAATIIVVDNGSSDETVTVAQELADLVLQGGPERSAQRNIGAAATDAPVLGFIDSDMILAPDVVRDAVRAIESGAIGVIVPERTVGEGYWAAVRAYERTFYEGSDAIEAARFYSRAEFETAGGFDEAMTGGEDWDLGLRAASLGVQVRIEPVIVHDEGRVRFLDACRKKAYYADGVALFLAKHRSAGRRLFSRRPWLRRPGALLRPLGIGLVALKVGEVTAVLGALGAKRLRRGGSTTVGTLKSGS
jgi:glycosyltransferase involved in cell wall biosynthesis